EFVRFWDRWCARHLAARLPEGAGLRFRLVQGEGGATGVVLASADRAGRRFPLTLAAPVASAADPAWLDALAAAGAAAVGGEIGADALEARLGLMPFAPGDPGAEAPGLAFWTEGGEPLAVDPEHPGPALDLLLALPADGS
ncbi:MAG TPA: TagF domain-containing protein, partial [Amaricoccus sp.]|nr:TagF domain-containing protein [Amaricoccus sp.]